VEELAPEHMRRRSTIRESEELDARLTELEQELLRMNRNEEALNKDYLELTELSYVLREADIVLKVPPPAVRMSCTSNPLNFVG